MASTVVPVEEVARPLVVSKSRVDELIDVDARLTRLIFAYLASATGWLVLGTLIGEYGRRRRCSPGERERGHIKRRILA